MIFKMVIKLISWTNLATFLATMNALATVTAALNIRVNITAVAILTTETNVMIYMMAVCVMIYKMIAMTGLATFLAAVIISSAVTCLTMKNELLPAVTHLVEVNVVEVEDLLIRAGVNNKKNHLLAVIAVAKIPNIPSHGPSPKRWRKARIIAFASPKASPRCWRSCAP